MATLDDKILGEKLHNYCSSSEESDGDSGDESRKPNKTPVPETISPTTELNKWEGISTNTGPKGVIEDWRKFKQLENEKRTENEKAKVELAKKLTMTVRSEEPEQALDDPELAELLNDEQFLLKYRKKRIEEMMHQTTLKKKFGEFLRLRTDQEFLDAIDQEDKAVTIIIHIFDNHIEACRNMNLCLMQLCKVYQTIKFAGIHASEVGVSSTFKVDGVPALLAYKAGHMVGNFVKITESLGNNFQVEDVQGFLIEHGLLGDKTLTPDLIRCSKTESDSE